MMTQYSIPESLPVTVLIAPVMRDGDIHRPGQVVWTTLFLPDGGNLPVATSE
jgi:hypothetical protein